MSPASHPSVQGVYITTTEDAQLEALTAGSEESYTTATSTSPRSAQVEAARIPDSVQIAPLPLRKSTSVDSFIKSSAVRGEPAAQNGASSSTHRDSILDPDLSRWNARNKPKSSSSSLTRSLLSRVRGKQKRLRGGSFSVNGEEMNYSSFEDSDTDQTHRFYGRTNTTRPRSNIPSSGELLHPTRLHTYTQSAERLDPASSTSSSRRHKPSALPLYSTSTLSSSSDVQAEPPDTLIDQQEPSNSSGSRSITLITKDLPVDPTQEFFIGVVGSTRCGKSSFVRKGLKNHGLSDAFSYVASDEVGNPPLNIHYTARSATFHSHLKSDRKVTVFEVNSSSLHLRSGNVERNVWPSCLPPIDGVFICYDASDAESFRDIEELLAGFNARRIPSIVMACKSDLDRFVSPKEALDTIQPYAGIIEVSIRTDNGKTKIRRSFDVLQKAITKSLDAEWSEGDAYRNPASPDIVNRSSLPWRVRSHSVSSSHGRIDRQRSDTPSVMPSSPTRSPSTPTSPIRARSTGDLLSEHQKSMAVASSTRPHEAEVIKSRSAVNLVDIAPVTVTHPPDLPTPERPDLGQSLDDVLLSDSRVSTVRKSQVTPWATFEQILEKLFFFTVNGDDPSYISHFFLTYRRFATPRSVLLGMQKRMLDLHKASSDPVLASFSQMKICGLLEYWMGEYPSDFTVKGTHGALSAFIKQTLLHAHIMHYGADLLLAIEKLQKLSDMDASWSVKAEDSTIGSDESDGIADDLISDESEDTKADHLDSPPPLVNEDTIHAVSATIPARERKSSLPLTKTFLSKPPSSPSMGRSYSSGATSPKELIINLQRISLQLLNVDSESIAREISRNDSLHFLKIQTRHWLRNVMVPGKKDPEQDPIARLSQFYNYLYAWASSLILCHDKPRARARQMEKFAEISQCLRKMNNYSSLRAIITAISGSTSHGDESMELFRNTKTEMYKRFQSYDVLFHSTGSHRSYRLALRNTKGACIPSLEVHHSDLIRANSGNPDFKSDGPNMIHWFKFNLMGKIIDTIMQCQAQCRMSNDYAFLENPFISSLLKIQVMDEDMRESRLPQQEFEGIEGSSPPGLSGTRRWLIGKRDI